MKQIPAYFRGDVDPLSKAKLNAMSAGAGIMILWQEGPIQDDLLNGATVEGVLRACVQRLTELQSEVPSSFNISAMANINQAIGYLEARTQDRHRRGVLGTKEV